MKYSLKKYLLTEVTQSPARAFIEDLISFADKHIEDYDTQIMIKHGQCQVTLSVEIPSEEDDPNYVHIGYLEVTDTAGDPDPACYRKGYAADMMQQVVSIADKHGVELGLSAEGVPQEQIDSIYGVDLPDMQELADFYGRYGFKETNRNSQQIYMQRSRR